MAYKDTVAKIKALRAQALEEAKACFGEESKRLFEKHPKLENFNWRQYTPYFNDGDPCEFSVHRDELDFEYDGKEFESVSEDGSHYGDDASTPEFCAAVKDVFELVRAFDEDDLEQMFGDHVEVFVT